MTLPEAMAACSVGIVASTTSNAVTPLAWFDPADDWPSADTGDNAKYRRGAVSHAERRLRYRRAALGQEAKLFIREDPVSDVQLASDGTGVPPFDDKRPVSVLIELVLIPLGSLFAIGTAWERRRTGLLGNADLTRSLTRASL